MGIKTIAIIGLGALGTMYADYLTRHLPGGSVYVIADQARRARYEREGVLVGEKPCNLSYLPAAVSGEPVDLLLFTTKFHHLPQAIRDAGGYVGEHTLILSAINGISSETLLQKAYGESHVLYCIAQGTDAVKEGNRLSYQNIGLLCFGQREGNGGKTAAVAEVFTRAGLPFETPENIIYRLWSKFMMNCGINQTSAVFGAPYGCVQEKGQARDTMIAAMREVMLLSQRVGVNLCEEDITYWLDIIATLSPQGMTSMLQDVRARRKTEVELFSGTVLPMAEEHGLAVPVNTLLYERIAALEREFGVAL